MDNVFVPLVPQLEVADTVMLPAGEEPNVTVIDVPVFNTMVAPDGTVQL